MTTLTWTTPAGLLLTATELVAVSTSVVASGTNISYQLISGMLPSGLAFANNGAITGTPNLVLDKTRSKFVIRASSSSTILDRTFYIDIQGASSPNWISTGGYLIINGKDYVFRNQYINYQFEAVAYNSPPNTKIEYYLNTTDQLPLGLTLNKDGTLTGIIKDTASDPLTQNYDFSVIASDSVSTSSRAFSMFVIDSSYFNSSISQSINTSSTNVPPGFTLTSISSLQDLQFISGSNLGTVRANNNCNIPVTIYDPAPYKGPVVYSLITGTTINTKLPEGLTLNTSTGYIYGHIPYQPVFSNTYEFTIKATKFEMNSVEQSTITNAFILTVIGEVDSKIDWVSSSTLQPIFIDTPSDSFVVAKHSTSTYKLKYSFVNGTLPDGITLEQDGALAGIPSDNSTGTYTFTVQASDVYNLNTASRTFNLEVKNPDSKNYTQIYVRPFLPENVRTSYSEFINNDFTFDPQFIYRYFDENFGVQKNIKMFIEFGIEETTLTDYAAIMYENFYKKQFYFGDLKVAVAKDSTGTVLYEVVYVDIVDDQMTKENASVSPVVYNNDQIYYPASVDTMRNRLHQIVMPTNEFISVNDYYLPKFMKTYQKDITQPLGYIKVVPICYALPGFGARIISRIKLSGFDFKMINFEVDRLIVQKSIDSSTAKYLMFPRRHISDTIANEFVLFGPDGVQITTDTGDPITI